MCFGVKDGGTVAGRGASGEGRWEAQGRTKADRLERKLLRTAARWERYRAGRWWLSSAHIASASSRPARARPAASCSSAVLCLAWASWRAWRWA